MDERSRMKERAREGDGEKMKRKMFKRFFNRNRWLLFFPHFQRNVRFVICLHWNANLGRSDRAYREQIEIGNAAFVLHFSMDCASTASSFSNISNTHAQPQNHWTDTVTVTHWVQYTDVQFERRRRPTDDEEENDEGAEFKRSQKIVCTHWEKTSNESGNRNRNRNNNSNISPEAMWNPAASSVMLTMANRKDKCFFVWFVLEGRRFAWKFNWLGKSLWISAISFCWIRWARGRHRKNANERRANEEERKRKRSRPI